VRVPDKYKEVKAEIIKIYYENKGRYGYRRITTEVHNHGFSINHKTVQRLMKELGLVCRVRIKKYRSYKGEVGKIAPNLLNRNFYAKKPNQKWVTDVTEFSLFGQKMYLSPILDLHNGYLVSYTISDRPVLGMITSMLEKAFETIPDGTGLILHSDQGWQYQHKQYQRMLRRKGIRQSMSRKGNCLDNAVMENFFGLLKSELLYLQEFRSLDHFKQELVDYLDYYNNRRIKKTECHFTIIKTVIENWKKDGYYSLYQDDIWTWAVQLMYWTINDLPSEFRKEYSIQMLDLMKTYDVEEYLVSGSEVSHYKEFKKWAESNTSSESDLNLIKKKIEQENFEIEETLKSRAFKLGKFFTGKKKRLDIDKIN